MERIRRGKVLQRCVCSAAREALGRPRGEERGGGILCRHTHSLYYVYIDILLLACDEICILLLLFLFCRMWDVLHRGFDDSPPSYAATYIHTWQTHRNIGAAVRIT